MATTTITGSRTGPRPASTADRPAVPWATVLPLALVLAYADGFWVTALRSAVGSIQRTSAPFGTWLRESTLLLLPLLVLAVLGALTLAQRRFDGRDGGLRAVVSIMLLVTGLGTLAGAAVLTVSSAYDYRLQVADLAAMSTMRDDCAAACQGQQVHATLALQERSVLLGTLFLLATNLLLVVWLVALRGGRVRLSSTRPGPSLARRVLDRVGLVRALLAAGLVGSAAIHAAVVPEHLAEWTSAGLFFVLLTLAELGVAAVVLVHRSPAVLLGAVLVSAGPVLLWLVSRTVGLPFGPEPGVPEAVGLADVVACVLEVGTLVAAVLLLRAVGSRGRHTPAHVLRLSLAAVVVVTAVGVGGSGLGWVDLLAPGAAM
jgi:hypothetical protein